MSRTRPTMLVAAALVAASVLTGCGAGQVASTAGQASNSTGGNVTVGTIAVRDAAIAFGESVEGGAVYTAGADAPLGMTIVNEGGDLDRLLSASSPSAGSVEVSGPTEIPGGRAIVVEGEGPPAATPAPARPASPSGSPTPAPTSSAPPTPGSGADESTSVVLTGLTEDIRAGVSYPVTLVFERAGAVTVDVPVASTSEPREAAEGAE